MEKIGNKKNRNKYTDSEKIRKQSNWHLNSCRYRGSEVAVFSLVKRGRGKNRRNMISRKLGGGRREGGRGKRTLKIEYQ